MTFSSWRRVGAGAERASRAALVVALCLALRPVSARAQYTVNPGDRLVGALAGASFVSSGGGHLGMLRNRSVFQAGLRAEWVLEAQGPIAIASTVELIPLILLGESRTPQACYFAPPGAGSCPERVDAPAVGAGLSPLGMKLYIGRGGIARLHGSFGLGGSYFSREIPVQGAGKFAFLVDYGAGLELSHWHSRSALLIAWRYQHWSNANLTNMNPGLDANLVYVGFLRRRSVAP